MNNHLSWFVTVLHKCMYTNCCNNYDSTENRPLAGTFADEEEYPDRVEERFDEADDRGVERACSAADAFDE